ncbi:MAG: hypothetical protein K9M57_04195 [Phycisphaerae bacterium]|nr:hypothetical protein [Phycisphaerae bacterium]
MKKSTSTCDRTGLIDLYFLEHRAKLIDIGAFLDRLNRADAPGNPEDFRIKAFQKASAILTDESPDKAKRILEVFSDHTPDLADSAPLSKGAAGAAQEEVK